MLDHAMEFDEPHMSYYDKMFLAKDKTITLTEKELVNLLETWITTAMSTSEFAKDIFKDAQ